MRIRTPKVVNRFLLIAFAVVGFSALYACAAMGPPQYDVCRTQLRTYVAENFDHTVTGIQLQYAEAAGSRSSIRGSGRAVVFVEECEGYHAFELFATYTDCETRAFYGNPPNLIRYRISAEGC